jgi:hypothetical protein
VGCSGAQLCDGAHSPLHTTWSAGGWARLCYLGVGGLTPGTDWREAWTLIWLEYAKVILSYQVIFGGLLAWFVYRFSPEVRGFLKRLQTFKGPGVELGAQASLAAAEQRIEGGIPQLPPATTPAAPHATAERANAALVAESQASQIWEFRYISILLVRRTQEMLDLIGRRQDEGQPITLRLFDTVLGHLPYDERKATFSVLRGHNLIDLGEAGVLTVTSKGRTYLAWRGPLQSLPPPAARDQGLGPTTNALLDALEAGALTPEPNSIRPTGEASQAHKVEPT